MAKLLGLPVLLVVDASRQARSAAATVWGSGAFDPGVRLAGRDPEPRGERAHRATVHGGDRAAAGLPVLGALYRAEALRLPERYLGLVPPAKAASRPTTSAAATRRGRRRLSISTACCGSPRPHRAGTAGRLSRRRPCRREPDLAVARDRAFGFYYAGCARPAGGARSRGARVQPARRSIAAAWHGRRVPGRGFPGVVRRRPGRQPAAPAAATRAGAARPADLRRVRRADVPGRAGDRRRRMAAASHCSAWFPAR